MNASQPCVWQLGPVRFAAAFAATKSAQIGRILILTVVCLACVCEVQASERSNDLQKNKAGESAGKPAPASAPFQVLPEGADEVPVGINGTCHFDSRCNVYIKIYVNGRYRGTMPPWGDLYPFVGDCDDDCTHLYAVSVCGRYSWRRTVYGAIDDFHWTLVP